MAMARFIRIHNKAVNVEQICYVDFLESGRAMVFVSGLTQEKQHIPVEPPEAQALKEFFEREYALTTVGGPAVPTAALGFRPQAMLNRF